MSSFTAFNTSLKLEYIHELSGKLGRDYWKVIEEFEFYLENEFETIYIPEGFTTDGATVPRVLWSLLPVLGRYGQAAVLHDYLLEGGKIVNKRTNEVRSSTRSEARTIFNDGMKALQVDSLVRRIIIAGVFVWDTINSLNPKTLEPSDFNKDLI